ncbi:hypothetical protein F5882DRAFT_498905, partial [Hyaloscypha sp. PMI_1271]
MLVTKQLSLLIAVCFATYVVAGTLGDIANLVSDLGPLLALFGELPTTQFMSQSLDWADNIVLAMAPLGVITIIVAAIRVGGPKWLKAVIGRARETHADVEVEVMSSTSDEVCELWDDKQIVRVTGEGRICEFIILGPERTSGKSVSSPKLDEKIDQEVLCLELGKNPNEKWLVKDGQLIRLYTLLRDSNLLIRAPEEILNMPLGLEAGLANLDPKTAKAGVSVIFRNTDIKAPNLTLNAHNQQARGELYLVAAIGIVLQLGVLAYSGCATFYPTLLFLTNGSPAADYAFPCSAAGTLALVTGMLICSHVVENSTVEERYRPKPGKEARIVFKSWAIFPEQAQPIITTSQRREDSSQSLLGMAPVEVKAVIGAFISICGYFVQFVGLRAMHWSASVAQLGAMVVMALLRALVRRNVAQPPKAQNLLPGHEIDWLAMTLKDINDAPWLNPKGVVGEKRVGEEGVGEERVGEKPARPPMDWRIVAVDDP